MIVNLLTSVLALHENIICIKNYVPINMTFAFIFH